MIRLNNICFGCDHFCDNNEDGLGIGCRSYPKGISTKIIHDPHSHDKVIKSAVDVLETITEKMKKYNMTWFLESEKIVQTGDYVYTPAKREKNIFGRKIEIYQ